MPEHEPLLDHCSRVWMTLARFDYTPRRQVLSRFLRALPNESIEFAHQDGPYSFQAQVFIVVALLCRFDEQYFRPGQPMPVIDERFGEDPRFTQLGMDFPEWIRRVQTWLAMESLYRRGCLRFDWPEGLPHEDWQVDLAFTDKGHQEYQRLERENAKEKQIT